VEILGYICSVIIGLTLGVLGSGGSILTVPVLVYLMQFNPLVATGYSLFIVGLTSLTGAISYMRKGLVDYKTAIAFALPSFISVYAVRRFVLTLIPSVLYHSERFILTKDVFIMLVFALLMISAAYSLIRNNKYTEAIEGESGPFNYPMILILGFAVGAMTGLVSVGGGFLIIPALVLFARVPIKVAVGTSLVIISTNAFIGFLGDLPNQASIDWIFLFKFCGFSIVGIVIGSNFARHIPAPRLKPIFGWFVLLMGCYIFIHELFIRGY
jgi:uncharacterized membrane protein YfcA